MDREIEFLNKLYQNAEMGRDSSKEVLNSLEEGSAIRDIIQGQLKDYEFQLIQIKELILKRNGEIEENSAMGKMMTSMSITMKTMMDASDSKIAEMMIQGSDMGVIDINKLLNDHPTLTGEVRQIAEDLLEMQQRHIQSLKSYL